MRLIDADALIEILSIKFGNMLPNVLLKEIDSAPTVELFCAYLSDGEVRQPCVEAPCKHERPQGENKIIELFNKYDILLVHIDGKIVPVKNSTKQECYELLYEIQELIEWRKLLFNKHLSEVQDDN